MRVDEVGTGASRRDFLSWPNTHIVVPSTEFDCTDVTRRGNEKVLQLERISARHGEFRIVECWTGPDEVDEPPTWLACPA